MTKKILLSLFYCVLAVCGRSQAIDSLAVEKNRDSALQAQFIPFDSVSLDSFVQSSTSKSLLLSENKPVVKNVQQYNSPKRNGYVFHSAVIDVGCNYLCKSSFR